MVEVFEKAIRDCVIREMKDANCSYDGVLIGCKMPDQNSCNYFISVNGQAWEEVKFRRISNIKIDFLGVEQQTQLIMRRNFRKFMSKHEGDFTNFFVIFSYNATRSDDVKIRLFKDNQPIETFAAIELFKEDM
jgi:hypothetical protein